MVVFSDERKIRTINSAIADGYFYMSWFMERIKISCFDIGLHQFTYRFSGPFFAIFIENKPGIIVYRESRVGSHTFHKACKRMGFRVFLQCLYFSLDIRTDRISKDHKYRSFAYIL